MNEVIMGMRAIHVVLPEIMKKLNIKIDPNIEKKSKNINRKKK